MWSGGHCLSRLLVDTDSHALLVTGPLFMIIRLAATTRRRIRCLLCRSLLAGCGRGGSDECRPAGR